LSMPPSSSQTVFAADPSSRTCQMSSPHHGLHHRRPVVVARPPKLDAPDCASDTTSPHAAQPPMRACPVASAGIDVSLQMEAGTAETAEQRGPPVLRGRGPAGTSVSSRVQRQAKPL
jgi:hypothetical protein